MSNILPTAPAYDADAVTPSDTGTTGNARGLYIGGAGDVKIDTAAGTTVTFVGALAGTVLPVQVARVYSTDTTATNIIALY